MLIKNCELVWCCLWNSKRLHQFLLLLCCAVDLSADLFFLSEFALKTFQFLFQLPNPRLFARECGS